MPAPAAKMTMPFRASSCASAEALVPKSSPSLTMITALPGLSLASRMRPACWRAAPMSEPARVRPGSLSARCTICVRACVSVERGERRMALPAKKTRPTRLPRKVVNEALELRLRGAEAAGLNVARGHALRDVEGDDDIDALLLAAVLARAPLRARHRDHGQGRGNHDQGRPHPVSAATRRGATRAGEARAGAPAPQAQEEEADGQQLDGARSQRLEGEPRCIRALASRRWR